MIEETLSELGKQRREQILSMAHGVARQRRRRLSVGRGFGVILMFAVAGATAWSLMQIPSPLRPESLPIAEIVKPAPPPILVEYVVTDSSITDRLSIKPEPPRWTTVGDEEFLADLAAAGQPAGIVCMNGKTFLLPR